MTDLFTNFKLIQNQRSSHKNTVSHRHSTYPKLANIRCVVRDMHTDFNAEFITAMKCIYVYIICL